MAVTTDRPVRPVDGDPYTAPAGGRRPSRPSTASTAQPQPTGRERRLTAARRGAVAVWAAVVVYRTATDGFAFNRELLLLYIATGLIAASIGRGHRVLAVVRDWLPFALVLVLYDFSRGAADMLGAHTFWRFQPEADRWLFFGTVPTVWLQEHIKLAQPPWWEVIISSIYMSFFVLPYIVAGVLWLRDRAAWAAFVRRFVALSFAALAVYVVLPAAPPWAAASCTPADVAGGPANPPCMFHGAAGVPDGGLLGAMHTGQPGAHQFVERISTRGWGTLHLQSAGALLDSGQASVNLVAAIPSLHAAVTAMISMFLWRRVRPPWRPLLLAYPLAMAFVLVYSAEHFVIDILLGWSLAAAVCAAMGLLEAWWSRRRGAESLGLGQPAGDLASGLAVEHPVDLLGDVAHVRGGGDRVQGAQRMARRQRLGVEDVQTGTGNAPGSQRVDQRLLVDDRAARGVD
ncbi:phosphatase PAP2 family protein [Mycobacterium paraterrae]|uniref:Phosphatase PAP2 family protein n=1 Tax=Mycobacterium paraterrae TaxID=577492 RepID=A0ABY3VHS8_9MYCO|nr:phosphatase PAP2 family protein [Mycobacterium paraterrae]UMB68156.1 phosphatase PAP2 family protein [Mycobacterium paraterrae]